MLKIGIRAIVTNDDGIRKRQAWPHRDGASQKEMIEWR
jgi:hypothetical protein